MEVELCTKWVPGQVLYKFGDFLDATEQYLLASTHINVAFFQ